MITADYIDITLSEAILALDLVDLMEACYDDAAFPGAVCDSFTRDASGQVVDFLSGQTNAQQFEVEFLNLTGSYGFDVARPLGLLNGNWADNDLGFLTTRARLSQTRKRLVSVTGTEPLSEVGEFEDPEWSGTFDFIWDFGENTRVFWRLLWQSAAKLDATGQNTFEDLNGNVVTETDGRFYNTASISYNFGHMLNGGDNDLIVQLSIENILGAEPDFLQLAAGHFTLAEMIGRRYTLGIRGRF